MKMQQTPYIALLSASAIISSGLHADAVIPDEPAAYEPFLMELTLPISRSGDDVQYVLDVDHINNEILIGYLNYGVYFMGTPYLTRTIEFQGLPPGTYSVKIAFMPDLADDNLNVINTGLSFDVAQPPATRRVYSFFHTGIEHYFITAWENEANGLLAQGGLDRWELVDFGFNVWHADDPAPESAVPVCRFYSELVNSHFYTGSANECTKLQEEDPDWIYEGIAFQALLPVKGACPAGTTPVWRLYNDRAAHLDSNHRFVASSETYRTMIAAGWIGEGVAFCSPPASEG